MARLRTSSVFLVAIFAAAMVLQTSAADDQGPLVLPIKCTHPISAEGKQLSVKCPFVAGSTTQRDDSVCRPLCPNPDVIGRCKGSTCRCCTTGV
ncbi:hypothetical protein GOP47_0026846 [Adiantum capillus-veneris]|nr:hypothetical protein GOP47_0026846 [Adiantum capillus-veneris]